METTLHSSNSVIQSPANLSRNGSMVNAETHSMEARQAAQFGDLDRLRQLLDSGEATPTSVDSDDCSLLHWAAINNRIEIAKLLIERKCNVNAIGGVLASTPLHWAARHGHSKMVSLLVRSGADWSLRDVEGFTALHISVQFGCTPVAAYLVAMGQSPDELDVTRMTPAIWAAYKVYGIDPLKMLATLGADLERSDGTYGNTPLHWAVVQGNHTAINTLIKLNADLMALNKEKETPLDIARRKNDLLAIRRLELAARERGILKSTWRQKLREDKRIVNNLIFSLPFLVILCAGLIFNSALDYFIKGELLTVICLSVSLTYATKERREHGIRTLLLGMALASKFFISIAWLTFLQPVVPWFMQIAFFILLITLPFLFYWIWTSDPGYINVTHKERCAMIIEMTEQPNFKGNFCSTCLLIRPSRSKHCQVCDRCVLRFDHHCPWVNNCIGIQNHRAFVLYLAFLNIASGLTFVGCMIYWRDVCGEISHINIVYCKPWVTMLQMFSLFYFMWVGAMLCIQAYQIFNAMTTNERINSHRYAHFHFGGSKMNIRSPFTQGCCANTRNFCCSSELRTNSAA
ncbi:DHHC palmitoyltransferase domain-containing protein [Ditylenchus destructor]|uniref:Palmitoyltransferase n=1 Tax=Ditylenchus destructor TaxID=166010 RepID=A0AAD4RBY9_9BILA|nr:DHHC palmitoyltransferase domain-containing protein [Ditylenchus destructor]